MNGLTPAILALIAVFTMGCRNGEAAKPVAEENGPRTYASRADGLITGFSSAGATHVRTVVGFHDPESVRYDAEQDLFFVSSMAGFGSLKDGIGYISRVRAASVGDVDIFIEGGVRGVTLNAPKGMTLQGDTLWVTDIDVVRGFHRLTGAPVATIDFSSHAPVLLNDIAAGPNGSLRVTDTGIRMVFEGNIHTGPDRIFGVDAARRVSLVAQGPELRQPNGVAWDSLANRWLVVGFDRFGGDLSSFGAADGGRRQVLHRSPGKMDGVEVLPGGAVIFSSWGDSSIHVWQGGRDVRVIREVPEPADIGLDTRRGRVAIPLAVAGQVQVWDLGRWWPASPREGERPPSRP